ncbi:MAG: hypothetical protein P4L22_00530, partial [Candidatus Babeliales bacterium]|nr:hypothetical protein [Candidatus Babeliales bacterium]
NNFSQINALALQADDRVVAGGFATGSGFPPVQQVALVRYNKNNTDFINITSIANNSVITTKVPIFSGTSSAANAQVQIIIDNVLFTTIPTDSSGNWTVQTNALTIGVHSILVKLVVSSIVVVSEKINFTTIETMGEDTLFAYSNVSQTTTTANTFQTITFNNLLGNDNNIWTNVGNNTLQYKAPETGKFFITYSAEAGILNAASATSINIAIRLLKNGTELPSQTNTQLNVPINGNGIQLLTNSGIVTLAQNDTIQLQYAKSTALAAGIIANQGSGTIRPSISVNILRLQ